MAAKSVRQVTLDFCKKKKNDPQLPGPALVTPLFLSPEIGGQADAAFELWQTECLYGTVFALRVSLVRMQQARRKIVRTVRILPAIEKIGKREKWTRSSFETSASSRTSTTANPRSLTACSK